MRIRNVSQGPQSVDGCGVLSPGEQGTAEVTPHTEALLDAGLVIEIPSAKRKSDPPAGEKKE